MKRFKANQRVLVKVDDNERTINKLGTVARLRRGDEGAWINLDERSEHCPFPEGDSRANNILAYPEDCEEA